MTTEELINDAKCNNLDPNAAEVRATFMHLFWLDGILKLTVTSADVGTKESIQYCLPKMVFFVVSLFRYR